MKKFLETLWARLEMNGKQLYDQQKLRATSINTYEVQTNHYDKDDFITLFKKNHYDSQNNSWISISKTFVPFPNYKINNHKNDLKDGED